MTSIKITNSNSEKAKRIRLLIHLINTIVITFLYVLLVNKVGAWLEIDVNKPLREYEKSTILAGLVSMLLFQATLYGISFRIISWIFQKFRI